PVERRQHRSGPGERELDRRLRRRGWAEGPRRLLQREAVSVLSARPRLLRRGAGLQRPVWRVRRGRRGLRRGRRALEGTTAVPAELRERDAPSVGRALLVRR